MSEPNPTMCVALITVSAVASNFIGSVAFSLVHSLCIAWSNGVDTCFTVGTWQHFMAMNAHLVPVLLIGFLFFVMSCRISRVRGSKGPALGMLSYSAISWLMAQWFEFTRVTPQEAMAVVFAGACGLVYFHWRDSRGAPHHALQATREDARA